MPDPLVGVVSCSGECCGYGTISRIATRLVMDEFRKNVVTICLPLFSLGDEGENDFAKRFPTITVDGCAKACASLATEQRSGPVEYKFEVAGLLKEWSVDNEFDRMELSPEGVELARRIAGLVAEKIDVIVKARKQ